MNCSRAAQKPLEPPKVAISEEMDVMSEVRDLIIQAIASKSVRNPKPADFARQADAVLASLDGHGYVVATRLATNRHRANFPPDIYPGSWYAV